MESKSDSMATLSNRGKPKLSEESQAQWGWVEPSVWTNPMLATLIHNSVRGGKIFLRGKWALWLERRPCA